MWQRLVLAALIITAATGVARAQTSPVPIPIPPLFLGNTLGAFCAAYAYNQTTYTQCEYPVVSSWTYISSTGAAADGPLTIFLNPTRAMPPYINTNDGTSFGTNYEPFYDGDTLENQFAKPRRRAVAYTFPFPSCAGELRWSTGFPAGTPATQAVNVGIGGAPIGVPAIATPPEWQGDMLVNHKPICATVLAEYTDVNCNIYAGAPWFGDPNSCLLRFVPPSTKTPPYAPFEWDPAFNGLPPAAEWYGQGAYRVLPQCQYWGHEWPAGGGNMFDTRDQGVGPDTGYPNPWPMTLTVFVPEAAMTQVVFGDLQLQFTGLFNRADYGPVRVDYNLTSDPMNPTRPWTTRNFFVQGLQCQSDAPRSPSTAPYLLANLVLFSQTCRVSLPFDSSIYGSEPARTQYLRATGGVYQPRSSVWLTYGSNIWTTTVLNLPSDRYKVEIRQGARSGILYFTNPAATTSIIEFPSALRVANRNLVQSALPPNLGEPQSGFAIFVRLFNDDNEFTFFDAPWTNPWLPACACNTTAAATDGNVLCSSDYEFLTDQVLVDPAAQVGATAVPSDCSISLAPGFSWYAGIEGAIQQAQGYGFVVNAVNASTSNFFTYQWYANTTSLNTITFDAPTASGTNVLVYGNSNVTISAALTAQPALITRTCHRELTVYRACPRPVITVSATQPTINVNTTLDASNTILPESNLRVTYTWSVLTAFPVGSEASVQLPYTDRPSVPITTSQLSVLIVQVRINATRPDDGTSCTSAQTVELRFTNGSLQYVNVGNPDNVLVPNACFTNTTFNGTIPPATIYLPDLPTAPSQSVAPIGSLSAAQTEHSANVILRVMHRLTGYRYLGTDAYSRQYLVRMANGTVLPGAPEPPTSTDTIVAVIIALCVLLFVAVLLCNLPLFMPYSPRSAPTARAQQNGAVWQWPWSSANNAGNAAAAATTKKSA
jgi:hypothetical protein